jgi:hypothetical protein
MDDFDRLTDVQPRRKLDAVGGCAAIAAVGHWAEAAGTPPPRDARVSLTFRAILEA